MAQVAGITVERSSAGKLTYAKINVRKHPEIIPFLQERGISTEKPIKWTSKMKRSFAQAKNGEITEVDLNNFWDV
ncbi:MAG: hypothetical protein LBR66_00420 [Candidatus Symbiothrix sp.]|jgi:hypothetical protein|nr:hypothetical protein [Candidatus Symbiothrix sp.]